MAQLLGVLEQGLINAVLALGVYHIQNFGFSGYDGRFNVLPLGAAVTALMISTAINPSYAPPLHCWQARQRAR